MNEKQSMILLFSGILLLLLVASGSASKDGSETKKEASAYSHTEDTALFQKDHTLPCTDMETETAGSTTPEPESDSPETMEPIEMLWYIIKMTSMVGSFICGLLLCHRSMKEKGQGKTTGIFFGLLGFVVLAIVLIGSTFPSFAEYEYLPNICWAALFAVLLVCTMISHHKNPNWPSMFIEEQNNDQTNVRHQKNSGTR